MATLAEFMPHVLPLVPGCPAPLAELTLRAVAIDFCFHAPVVQELLDPIDMIAGQTEYDIDLPYGSNVTLILEAFYLGQRMGMFKTGDEPLPDSSPGWLVQHAGPAPYALRQAAGNTFSLDRVPAESVAEAIVLRVATRPVPTAGVLDDVLRDDYAYEIGAGTAARLMLMPGQLFSNPKLAPTYQAIYLAARTEARIRAERSFGMAATRVRPRPFQ